MLALSTFRGFIWGMSDNKAEEPSMPDGAALPGPDQAAVKILKQHRRSHGGPLSTSERPRDEEFGRRTQGLVERMPHPAPRDSGPLPGL